MNHSTRCVQRATRPADEIPSHGRGACSRESCRSRFVPPFRAGLTLVEVVAAMVLASTLLVSMLAAYRVHRRQIVRAVRQREANQIADTLMARWMTSRIPRRNTGTIQQGDRVWRWRTLPIRTIPIEEGIAVEVVRFDLYDAASRASRRPVVTLEVMRPLDPAPRRKAPKTERARRR